MRHIPILFSRYLITQFFIGVGIVFGGMAGLILLIQAIETLRSSVSKDIPLWTLIQMVGLKFPMLAQQVFPFSVLVGTVLTFTRLTRSQELVIARAAGISAWQFLMPAVIASFLLGVGIITMYNPVACAMLSRYEQMESKRILGKASLLSVSSSGLWLRQKEADGGETVIHSLKASSRDGELHNVIIFFFGEKGQFIKRLDAEDAQLEEGAWKLQSVILTTPQENAQRLPSYTLPTSLTLSQIQESFASPDTLSFWELPGFIRTLKAAGFSALRHELHWQQLLATPFMLAGMVLIGALFSLHSPRFRRSGMMMGGSIFAGFLIRFATDFISAVGLSGSIPLALAAWAPVCIILLVGIAFLLHLEDG